MLVMHLCILNLLSVTPNGRSASPNGRSVSRNRHLIQLQREINLIKKQKYAKVQATRNVKPQRRWQKPSVSKDCNQPPVGHKGVCQEFT